MLFKYHWIFVCLRCAYWKCINYFLSILYIFLIYISSNWWMCAQIWFIHIYLIGILFVTTAHNINFSKFIVGRSLKLNNSIFDLYVFVEINDTWQFRFWDKAIMFFVFLHSVQLYCFQDWRWKWQWSGQIYKWQQQTSKFEILNGLPVPVFFTLTLIEAGTELEYNYGGGKYAWRMKG